MLSRRQIISVIVKLVKSKHVYSFLARYMTTASRRGLNKHAVWHPYMTHQHGTAYKLVKTQTGQRYKLVNLQTGQTYKLVNLQTGQLKFSEW